MCFILELHRDRSVCRKDLKGLIEKSRECHNHKPQAIPDTKRKRKRIEINACKMKNEPPHDKTNKMACAPSEDSDQPGHSPSLIRVFAVRMKKHSVLS